MTSLLIYVNKYLVEKTYPIIDSNVSFFNLMNAQVGYHQRKNKRKEYIQ